MIHVELSVAPHWQFTHYTEESMKSGGPWVYAPNSKPPHVILEREFATWPEAKKWYEEQGFVAEGIEHFWDNPDNEYVGVEIELMELTGTEYTVATLSVEGNEDR